MPFTHVAHDHETGALGRAKNHWRDFDEAAQELCDRVEKLADAFRVDSPLAWIVLLRGASIAASTGYVVFDGIQTIAVIEIDRPDQPIEELADQARVLLAEIESCDHQPQVPL